MTGTVACSFSAAFRPSPPRGMIRSTRPSWVAISRSSSRSPPATSEIAAAGRPAAATASGHGGQHGVRVGAVDEPRSTIALPDFRHSAEQSIVTFGRAS